MHTTLYIDIDEEITSIIDRVRKSDVSEVIIVAPKNALLLQSAVNLRLLKKEADRRKKRLLIITQDKIGKKLIEKAGILVKSKPGNDVYLEEGKLKEVYEPIYKKEANEIKGELQKEELEKKNFGSSEYFDNQSPAETSLTNENVSPIIPLPKKVKEKDEKKSNAKVRMSDIVASRPKPKSKKQKKDGDTPPEAKNIFFAKSLELPVLNQENENMNNVMNASEMKQGQISMKKAEKFFRGSRRRKKKKWTQPK